VATSIGYQRKLPLLNELRPSTTSRARLAARLQYGVAEGRRRWPTRRFASMVGAPLPKPDANGSTGMRLSRHGLTRKPGR
jgi:hypothetical protein